MKLNTRLDVTLTKDEAEYIAAFIADESGTGDDVVRLMVGDGHAGYGLYAAHPEYPEEGAILVKNLPEPAGVTGNGHQSFSPHTPMDSVQLDAPLPPKESP